MSETERLEQLCIALETEVEELMEENKRLTARIAILENREYVKIKRTPIFPKDPADHEDYENVVEFPMGAEEMF